MVDVCENGDFTSSVLLTDKSFVAGFVETSMYSSRLDPPKHELGGVVVKEDSSLVRDTPELKAEWGAEWVSALSPNC